MIRRTQVKTIRFAVASAALLSAFVGSSAMAQLPVGPPITTRHPGITVEQGSYRLLPIRAADPDRGLSWGMATSLAHPQGVRSRMTLVCVEFGRVIGDQLGAVTDESVFRPFTPGAGPALQCGQLTPRFGDRAYGYSMLLQPERYGAPCVLKGNPAPAGVAICDPSKQRTLFGISLGRGILSAETRDGDGWRALPTSADGTYLVVYRGTFNDATLPSIRIRATLCGRDARTDIRGWAMTREGCTLTFEIPNGPRPAAETRASRRARNATQLDRPVRIIERTGVASIRRFTARLKVPITIRDVNEGYATRIRGPAGRNCRSTRHVDTSGDFISSYLMIAGKPYDLPLLPLDLKRGTWCNGTYDLQLLYARKTPASPRHTAQTKVVAHTTFRVGSR